jgi:hypothetical protein
MSRIVKNHGVIVKPTYAKEKGCQVGAMGILRDS